MLRSLGAFLQSRDLQSRDLQSRDLQSRDQWSRGAGEGDTPVCPPATTGRGFT
jgi:hypothetical protein